MRTRKLFCTLITGLVLIASPALLALGAGEGRPAAAPDAVWHVCPAGPPTCDYAAVQEAIDAAGDGDTIKVAAGTYSDLNSYGGLAQVVYLTKTVALRGGYTTAFTEPPDPAANPTILDAQGGGRVVLITGTTAPTLEGFTITNGDATGLGGGPWPYDGVGGGIYVVSATATISNCYIADNVGSAAGWGAGGGVYLWWSDALLIGNNIHSNVAGSALTDSEGGGIAMSDSAALLERNDLLDNIAGSTGDGLGGGIYMECFLNPDHPQLHKNLLRYNMANGSGGTGLGGGIFAGVGSDPEMVNNVLVGNTSGGTTYSAGAGLYAEGTTFTMTHSTISANSGWDSNGVYAKDSHIHMVNTIVTFQAGTAVNADANSAVTVTAVLWFSNGANTGGDGTVIATGEITGSPNLDLDGYHIVSPSLAIDNGIDAGIADDVDGQVRPYGVGPDLGADEWSLGGCIPVSAASITGPTTGYTDTTYAFTAVPMPGDASAPFTYTWVPAPDMGQGMPTANYAWASAGTYVLTATIANCGGSALATHTIAITAAAPACPYPLTDLAIVGPQQAFVGFPVPFAAAVVPPNATEPISYNWSPVPDSGQGTPLVVYTWTTTGTKSVAVDAMNCGGSAGDSVLIDIRSEITGTAAPTVSLTIVYTDPQGISTTVEVPAGAVTETTVLVLTPVFSPTYPVSPGLAFANHNLKLNAYRNGPLPGFTFAQPVTITIGYSDADVRWLDEGSLGLYYWDGAGWADATTTCSPPSVYVRDPVQNILQVPICHLSDWGMMGMPAPRYDLYLPIVLRAAQ